MAPESTNAFSNDGDKQKGLDQEVRELISALTSRIGSIQRSQKPGGSSTTGDDDEQGVNVITLAGSNLGATMRGEMDDKTASPQGQGDLPEQEDTASYVVNSNFQAINNSIMLGGTYKTNDPGVHLDITDYVDQDDTDKNGRKRGTNYKSDQYEERSENDSETERA